MLKKSWKTLVNLLGVRTQLFKPVLWFLYGMRFVAGLMLVGFFLELVRYALGSESLYDDALTWEMLSVIFMFVSWFTLVHVLIRQIKVGRSVYVSLLQAGVETPALETRDTPLFLSSIFIKTIARYEVNGVSYWTPPEIIWNQQQRNSLVVMYSAQDPEQSRIITALDRASNPFL